MKSIKGTITAVDVKKSGAIYVKVNANGFQLGGDSSKNDAQRTIEAEPSIKPASITYKVIKAFQDSPSALKTTSSYSALIGGPTNRIVSSNQFGNFIVGPTAFTAHPENIRIGVFRLNGLLTSTVASTMITPIPVLVFDFPLKDTISNLVTIAKDYKQFLSEILS